MLSIQRDVIDQIKSTARGEVLLPDDPAFEEARTIWNAMIDRRPGIIVRCFGVADVMGVRSVRIDPEARCAYVEPGATLADFDREAQAFALATPLGINSTRGVAGLTLGGGSRFAAPASSLLKRHRPGRGVPK